jgi:hypothetical protein
MAILPVLVPETPPARLAPTSAHPGLRFVLLACLVLFTSSTGPPARAQSVCHDGNWDPGEFCGRDAWIVTGRAEMNHDCWVDVLDFELFVHDFITFAGPNLSGDFNGDGFVLVSDWALYLAPSFGNPVSPCRRRAIPSDGCRGSIALSFSDDPNAIVSTLTDQDPGMGSLYVVVEGWEDASIMEYSVETSSNIAIVDHWFPAHQHWETADVTGSCDPDPRHSYRGTVLGSPGSWPAGPIIWNSLDYELLDANPAWVQLVPVPSCYANTKIRWARAAADRSFDFATVQNVGINGPAPAGVSTCSAQIPALDRRMFWLLSSTLLAIAAVALGHRRLRSATGG